MISMSLSRLAAPLASASFLLAACGGATAPSATAAPTATPTTAAATATPTASATAATTAKTGMWTVNNTSKATVRVREQLVGVNLPSDDVGFNQPGPGCTGHLPERQRGRQGIRGTMGNRLALNLVIQTVQEGPVGKRGGGRIRPEILAHHSALVHQRMRIEALLDLDGIDVLTGAQDHVARP